MTAVHNGQCNDYIALCRASAISRARYAAERGRQKQNMRTWVEVRDAGVTYRGDTPVCPLSRACIRTMAQADCDHSLLRARKRVRRTFIKTLFADLNYREFERAVSRTLRKAAFMGLSTWLSLASGFSADRDPPSMRTDLLPRRNNY